MLHNILVCPICEIELCFNSDTRGMKYVLILIQVRKLEFILADALQQGCKHIITCGGHQSNHCRATATAAAQLGMKCHIFLRARGDVSICCSVIRLLRCVEYINIRGSFNYFESAEILTYKPWRPKGFFNLKSS